MRSLTPTSRSTGVTAGRGDQGIFETAPVIVQEHYHQPRLIPNAIEPRGCLASSIPSMGEFTLWSATQIPHIAKVTLSGVCGIPEEKLRVIAPDVGGSFGSKLNVYAEEALALTLARVTGRPVKWIEERSENYVATIHGRGVTHDCTLAGTPDGKILGLKFVEVADLGAYYQLLTPGIPELGGWVYMGPYNPEAYWFEFRGVLTNTTPTDAYRGAGRPEATYVLERLVDAYARQIGKDPAEVRRMNFHPPFDEATTSICGLSIDSGNYEPALDRALELADYPRFRKEQQSRRDSGDTRQIGIGLSTYIEMCGLAPSNILGALRYAAGGWDAATIRCLPTGKVVVATGTSPHGQGHETTWSQIVADGLGCHARRHHRPARGHAGLTAGDGHVRFAVGVRRRCRAAFRDGEDQGEGAHDRRARAGGVGGRPGVRRQRVPCEGRSGQGEDDPGAGAERMARARSAGRDRAEPGSHGGLRPAELHVAVGHAHLRGRG